MTTALRKQLNQPKLNFLAARDTLCGSAEPEAVKACETGPSMCTLPDQAEKAQQRPLEGSRELQVLNPQRGRSLAQFVLLKQAVRF